MSTANKLLQELGQVIGFPDLNMDQDGKCILAFDEHVVVTFVSDRADALSAFIRVADFKPSDAGVSEWLLSCNFIPNVFGGGRLAIEHESQSIVLMGRWDAARTDLQSLQIDVEEFIKGSEVLRTNLNDFTANQSETSTEATPTDKIPPSMFI
ncbi:MAG: type III secretion system chaperone [Alphaproteobacteria bacterium]|nr:type III secretion system chaperone [Alphaproteobacteria bacterium]